MKKYFPLILVALVAAGAGFGGGMSYQSAKSKSAQSVYAQFGSAGGFRGDNGGGGRQGRFGGGGFVGGEVLSKDDKSITVKLRSGGSETVYYSSSTTVSKPTDVTIDQVSVGDQVAVTGKANADGSVTAGTIQVRPPMPTGGPETKPPSGQ